MFSIKMAQSASIITVADQIQVHINRSRFKANVTYRLSSRAAWINIDTVRLRTSKPYCGNHPDACEIGGSDRKAAYLEGADWVAFNDLLNDVLDDFKADAQVGNSVVHIRDGLRRRVRYTSETYGRTWRKRGADEDYRDCTGRVANPSEYPEGTPGEYSRV